MAKEQEWAGLDVFHGSAVEGLERLELRAAGSGEGAAIRGFGLYFSARQDVAEFYRKSLAAKRNLRGVKGSRYGVPDGDALDTAVRLMTLAQLDPPQFAQYLDGGESYLGRIAQDIQDGVIKMRSQGNVYAARIPSMKLFLNWDALMCEQSQEVRAILATGSIGVVTDQTDSQVCIAGRWFARRLFGDPAGQRMSVGDAPASWTGGEFYAYLSDETGGPKEASAYLAKLGIAGNTYVGESSGATNFVVFDEASVKALAPAPDDRFIAVGGKLRPRHDSAGRLIHPSDTGLRNFWRWFGNSRAVDEQGRPLALLHGTTQDFTQFDVSQMRREANVGRGVYMSNSEDDVIFNYATQAGADLCSRYEMLVEVLQHDGEIEADTAREQAAERLMPNLGVTMQLYASLKKPVILGGADATRLRFFPTAYETQCYADQPKGSLNRFLVELRYLSWQDRHADVDFQKIESDVLEALEGERWITVEQLLTVVAKSEGLRDAFDVHSDAGDQMLDTELPRQALAAMGFDGVIDRTVSNKFGAGARRNSGRIPMLGVEDDTIHFIAFSPEQVKSATGNSGAFSRRTADLRFSRVLPSGVQGADLDAAAGLTVEQVRQAVGERLGQRLLEDLERAGLLQVVQSQQDLVRAAEGEEATSRYDPRIDGITRGLMDTRAHKAYLVADALDAQTAVATVLHEVGIHMASDGSLDALFERAGELVRTGGTAPATPVREQLFFSRVRERMQQAGCTGNEEAAAYLADEYEVWRGQAPRSVRTWFSELRSAVRAWFFVRGIATDVKDLQPGDVAAIAAAKVRQLAAAARHSGAVTRRDLGRQAGSAREGAQIDHEAVAQNSNLRMAA